MREELQCPVITKDGKIIGYGGDQEWFPEYFHGLYKKDNFQMFITSGLGSNKQKLPRFNNPPEIAVLDIKI